MASRNITLALGPFTVPCRMESAALPAPPSISSLCVGQPGHEPHEASPRRQTFVCETCGPIVDDSVLVKGVKVGKAYTLVDAEALATAKAEFGQQYKGKISLLAHPAEQINTQTTPSGKVYYLTPASQDAEALYQTILRLTEEHPELVFSGLYTPVSVTGLYTLRPWRGVLVMEERARSQELRDVPSIGGAVSEHHAMIEGVLPMFTQPYDPTAYEDTYRTALDQALVDGEQVLQATAVTGVAMTDNSVLEQLRALKGA